MNSTVMATKIAVPFMFIVAPRGSTKPETSRGTPNCCSESRIVVGSVAFEELVVKAVSITVLMARRKPSGLRRARIRTRIG